VGVTPQCNNEGQYGCVSVSSSPISPDAPEAELNDDEARDYVLGYVNGVRKLNGNRASVRDEALDAFAQQGATSWRRTTKQNQAH